MDNKERVSRVLSARKRECMGVGCLEKVESRVWRGREVGGSQLRCASTVRDSGECSERY